MTSGIYSLVSQERLHEILDNLQACTGLSIRLLDSDGKLLQSFGALPSYCSVLTRSVFSDADCLCLGLKAGRRAHLLGESYLFTCLGNLNQIVYPLVSGNELLCCVLMGPFLMDEPDSTLVADLADANHLSPALSLELYDGLSGIPLLTPFHTQKLMKMMDHLLSPILPNERVLLIHKQEKAQQQAGINETIQNHKEQKSPPSLMALYEMEKAMLTRVRNGNTREIRSQLQELLGYASFCEGGKMDALRSRSLEIATLLSRAAIDGGARADSIYDLNTQFLPRMCQETSFDELCLLLQQAVESYIDAMLCENDKGNLYIRKALRYMSDNYSDRLDLAGVAAYVKLSPSYFSTLFHQTVGVSFREQLCRIRVEESKRLLLTTDKSLAEVAVTVGFPDQSYYCKAFKRIVGLTPGKYRA